MFRTRSCYLGLVIGVSVICLYLASKYLDNNHESNSQKVSKNSAAPKIESQKLKWKPLESEMSGVAVARARAEQYRMEIDEEDGEDEEYEEDGEDEEIDFD